MNAADPTPRPARRTPGNRGRGTTPGTRTRARGEEAAVTALPRVRVSAATPRGAVVVIGVGKGADGPVPARGAESLADRWPGGLTGWLAAARVEGRAGEVLRLPVPAETGIATLVTTGLGPAADSYSAETLRRAAGAAARSLAGEGDVTTTLVAAGDSGDAIRAVAEGFLLGAYDFVSYRATSRTSRRAPLAAVTLVVPDARARTTTAALAAAVALADAVTLVRDLVNTPPGDLPPARLAERARAAAEQAGLKVEVLDEKALARGGYGGILGVGQGSANPPRLVRIDYTPARARTHLALVGKGITFDSGGLSIKPAGAMETMKSDMAGAATVLGAVLAVAAQRLPVRITAWMPTAENMPSGTAIRPSDVLTTYAGTRVEVLNTDAEGRLVLADALARAAEDRPDLIVDVATLTGAQVVALGARTAAVMANTDTARDQLLDAARAAGEQFWPMPLPEELRPGLDSPIADLANIGDARLGGGMLVAGLFLREFIPDAVAWAHLDIAGPAFNSGAAYGYTPRGGTGVAVRTLVRLAEHLAGAKAAG